MMHSHHRILLSSKLRFSISPPMAIVWIAANRKQHHALLPSSNCLRIFIKTNGTGEKSLIMNSNHARPVKTNINNIKKNNHYSRTIKEGNTKKNKRAENTKHHPQSNTTKSSKKKGSRENSDQLPNETSHVNQ